jgi:hypothetical protein
MSQETTGCSTAATTTTAAADCAAFGESFDDQHRSIGDTDLVVRKCDFGDDRSDRQS